MTSDMPIDPNEPLYCYCQQVSYGEMVACDNEDVSLLVVGCLVCRRRPTKLGKYPLLLMILFLFVLSVKSNGFTLHVSTSKPCQRVNGSVTIVGLR